jgi:ribose/xylose/arabinose/galactoside ABC-type transport system permease subunit
MTEMTVTGGRVAGPLRGWQRYVPILGTASLLLIMYVTAAARYDNFLSGQVAVNLLIDNSFLLVVAVGMTFVILAGGIDLSVGSMMGLATMICASLVERHHWPPLLVIPFVLLVGAAAGWLMGAIIHYFEIQPFIVTLAGLFLLRGMCFVISTDSIPITDPVFTSLAQSRIPLGNVSITPSVIIGVVVVVVAFVVLHYLPFGRNVYALGGSEQSALLMGLPVARTKIAVYTVSGFCAALAGVVMTFYQQSGTSLNALGMELVAIATVVIGGTLLTGGYGYIVGTVLGVLVYGMIQTIITFQGTLSSWWTNIVIGALLFVFIVAQRAFTARRT